MLLTEFVFFVEYIHLSSLFDYEKKDLKQKVKTKILLIFQSWSQYWPIEI